MFRTKAEVDRHVLAKSAKFSDRERAARSYSFAQLYYGVGDYETCRRYVSNYLTASENNAAAHTLLGSALLKLGHKEKSLEEFKISYELDSSQKHILFTVCELLADKDVQMDVTRAKHWYQLAEIVNPHHSAVFQLKERVISTTGADPTSLEKLLEVEMKTRPDDVALHARYLRQLVTMNKVNEVFEKGLQLELDKDDKFRHNFIWYETLIDILNHNKLQSSPTDWEQNLLYLIVLEKSCSLSLLESATSPRKSMSECLSALHNLDQALFLSQGIRGLPELVKEFLTYFKGQICFHMATCILKKAKRELIIWRDAVKSATPFLLLAFNARPPEEKPAWLSQVPDNVALLLVRWRKEASYRCSQAGHVLQGCMKENRRQLLLDEINQTCSNPQWSRKIYNELFCNKDQLAKVKTSYLVQTLKNPDLRLPRLSEINFYDEIAQLMSPDSLHHLVWLGLNYNLPELHCNAFGALQYAVQNVSNCSPESLCQVDIDAFLYCTILTARQKISQSNNDYKNNDKPSLLPANITELLCSVTQMKWWECAYSLHVERNLEDAGDKKSLLIRGIETIRCIGDHGMPPALLCALGNIFSDRANTSKGDKIILDDRAALYYAAALPLLEEVKLRSANSHCKTKKKIFDYVPKELSSHEINSLLEETKLFLGIRHMNDGIYEKAAEMLSSVKSPYGSYHLFYIYKRLSDEQVNFNKESITSEMRSKRITLLTKARQAAFMTMERIKSVTNAPKKHPLYSDVTEQLQNIELKLCRIDPDVSNFNRNECDGKYSSDDESSKASLSEHIGSLAMPLVNSSLYVNASSTPKHRSFSELNSTANRTVASSHYNNKKDPRITSDRLDYHIKQLQKKESLMACFIDQTKEWLDTNRDLADEVREIKRTVSELKSVNLQDTIDQFKTLKLSIDQIRDRMLDHRNESKSEVKDLRKEITELKKEISKVKEVPLNRDPRGDVCFIDENQSHPDQTFSNSATQLPFPHHQSVLPGFSQRIGMPPVNVPPSGSFNPFSMQNQLFLYNQYPHLTQFPPFFDGSRPVFPGHSNLFPGDQLYPDITQLLGQSNIPTPVISQAPPPPSIPTPVLNVRPTPVQPVSQSQSNSVIEPPKSLPLNVVITSSDPLPTRVSIPQPTLSVTIPPEHIKGNIPHNYQIPLPFNTVKTSQNANVTSVATPKLGLNNVTTVSSFGTPKMSTPTVNSIFGTPSNLTGFFDTPKSKDVTNTSANADKSRTLSEKSNVSVEYDPCPDFKPIIPLPDEVEINTGEEDEIELFKSRAKLFRFNDKQWKERGIGDVKLLKNKVSGKVRLLMRREQIHKICANHIITADMELQSMKGQEKAYIWVANDFADEVIILEKFCIRFKTANIARDFYDAFEKARLEEKGSLGKGNSVKKPEVSSKSFGDKFKPKLGSWTCNTCYVSNEPSKDTCLACGSSKGTVQTNESQKSSMKSNVETEKISGNVKNSPAFTSSIFETKPVLGGLTFSSTPTFKPAIKLDNVENEKETEKSKVNPFATFTFTVATSTVSSFPTIQSTGFTTIPNTSFTLTPSTGLDKTQNEQLNVSSSSDHVEEFTPTAEFKPVIPLPKLVEVKTGEENEEVLFEHKAKLLRFDTQTKEWKERGLGNMKLLRNNESRKLRLLMRREQIYKVCCNHFITKEIEFSPMPNIKYALTWYAPDFSENEVENIMFCVRFKTSEICDDFLNAIKQARDNQPEKLEILENKNTLTISKVGFGDQFKPKLGSWTCTVCLVNNDSSAAKCISCATNRIQVSKSEPEIENKAKPFKGFGDLFKPKPGTWVCSGCYVTNDAAASKCVACSSVNPKSGDEDQNANKGDNYWECLSCKMKNDNLKTACIVCNVAKGEKAASAVPKFSFGIPSGTLQTNAPSAPNISAKDVQPTFSFGTPTTGTDFKLNTTEVKTPFVWSVPSTNGASLVQSGVVQNKAIPTWNAIKKISETGLVTPTKQEDGSVSFAVNRAGTFGFQMTQQTPETKSSKSKEEGDSGDECAPDEENDGIHFDPIIPLPDMVEVVTGEEGEEVLSLYRAKLYRFMNSEYKERGTGDVKILRHKDNKKLRVVMRRDHVLKICLNHALTADINYTRKDDKSWLFNALDFSEGQSERPQQFCLRFKTKDIAEDFKNSVDSARSMKPNEPGIVNEPKPDQGDVEAARKLKLPDNFFDYRTKEKCKGCRGCNDDNFNFPPVDVAELDRIHEDVPIVAKVTDSQKQPSNKETPSSTPVKTVEFKLGDVIQSGIPGFSTPGARQKPAESEVFSTPQGSFGATPNEKPFTDIFAKKNAELNSSSIFSSNNSQNLFGFAPKTTSDNVPHFSLSPSKLGTSLAASSEPSKISVNFFGQPLTTETQQKMNVFSFHLKDTKKDDDGVLTKDKENESSNEPLISKKFFGATASGESAQKAAETGGILPEAKTETEPISASGGNSFTFAKSAPVSSATSLFGGAPTAAAFGQKSAVNGNFFPSALASSVFAPKVVQNSATEARAVSAKNDGAKETFESKPMFNVDNSLLFSSLAAKSNPEANFAKTENFEWEGAGQKLFTAAGKTKAAEKQKDRESDDKDVKQQVENEYDPHYEPIVPLPDEIDVKTGEEEEEVMFSERGILYRFDSDAKEWKERGIGNIKILYHEERNTHRLLLRRDQVYKVVLNQLITPDLELHLMMRSDRAWTWAGRNHAESDVGSIENLSVRFKLPETARKFKDKVDKAIAVLTSRKKDGSGVSTVILGTPEEDTYEPPTYAEPILTPETVEIAGEDYFITHDDDDDDQEHDDDDQEHDDYEDYENDDGSLMCSMFCDVTYIDEDLSIKDALLRVVYESELFLGKIIITDGDGLILTNMLVLSEGDIHMSGTMCEWSGLDNASLDKNEDPETVARNRSIRAVFRNDEETLSFHSTYMECISFGRESLITEGDHQHDIGAEED